MTTTGRGEDGKKKRKRKEDCGTGPKKRRGAEEGGLEAEETTPGSSHGTGTSSPYPRLTISRFTLHQVLGRGFFGKVVLASIPGRKTYMAVKMIKRGWENTDDIQRERRVLLAARACPFLCHLYATYQSQERAYFIMEYLSGGSLDSLIRMCGRLDMESVRFYTAEMVCGLQFLHGHNIVHRDLKADNIMLDAEGHIRIIDLGLARDASRYGTAVDWRNLGLVVRVMATGCFPYSHQSQFPPGLDDDAKHLVKQLLCGYLEKGRDVCGTIRLHPFFSSISWEELEQRRARPPFTPFSPVLGSEHQQWPDDNEALHPVPDFSYVSPSWAR